ncbi:hypothetical protein [Pseudoneobacillus sp. C159]
MNFQIEDNLNINKLTKILLILGFLALLSELNSYMYFVTTTVTAAIILYLIFDKNNLLFILYPFFILFENQFLLPLGMGSISRIYILAFLIKYFLMHYRTNIKMGLGLTIIFIKAIILFSLDIYNVLSGQISLAIASNIIIIILLRTLTNHNKEIFNGELLAFGIGALFSVFYGIVYSTSINYNLLSGGVSYSRITSTISDPNYTAFIINVALIIFLGIKDIFKKNIQTFLFVIMLLFLIMTVSIHGILTFITVFLIYVILYKGIKGKIKMAIYSLVFILLFTLFGGEYSAILINRISETVGFYNEGNYEQLTNHRSELSHLYISEFKSLPIKNQFFGGELLTANEVTRMKYKNMVGDVSHNSYIDMLFSLGIVGIIIVLFLLGLSIILNYKNYKRQKNNIYLTLICLKLVLLIGSAGISIFPYKYFIWLLLM